MKKEYLDYALEQLENIVGIPSPSGFTDEVSEYVFNELKAIGLRPERTVKGGVIVELKGEKSQDGPLILCSHLDTLGAMVMTLKENGRLKISPIGGMSPHNTETENVSIHTRTGKKYSGVFQLENPAVHVNKEYNEKVRTFDNMEVVVDEKVKNKDDLLGLGINSGDLVTFNPRFSVTDSGFIKSRFLDDKLSCAILLALAKALAIEDILPNRKLYLYFTVFEEVGHGAGGFVPEDAEEIIAVDMGCVGEGLNCDETMVSIGAKDTRGPSTQSLVNRLADLCEANKINYCVDVYPFYNSDADLAVNAGYEMRHCVLGAGVAASHGYERSHVEGLSNTFDLLYAYVVNRG